MSTTIPLLLADVGVVEYAGVETNDGRYNSSIEVDAGPNSAEMQDAAELDVDDADVDAEVDSAVYREGDAPSLVSIESDANSIVSRDSYAELIASKEDSIDENIGKQNGGASYCV